MSDFHSYMINALYGQGPYPSSYLKYGIGSLLAIRITFTQNFTFSNANAKLPILIGSTEYLCSYLEMYPDTGGAYADTYTHYFGLNIPEGSFGDITLFSNPIQLNGAQLVGPFNEEVTLGNMLPVQVARPYTVNGIRPTPPFIESVDHETGLVNVSGVPLTDPDGYKNRLSWSFDYGVTFPLDNVHWSNVDDMHLPAGDWPAGSIGVKVVDTAGNKSNPSFNTDRILVGNGGENPTQNPPSGGGNLSVLKTLTAGYEASSAAPLMVFMQVPYENEFIAKTFVSIRALWFAKTRLQKALSLPYAGTSSIEKQQTISTGFATLIEKPLKLAYEQTAITVKTLGLHYALTYPVFSSLRAGYDLLNVNRLSKTTSVPMTFEGDINAYLATPSNAVMVTGLGSINPIRMEVSTSGSENVWQVSAQVPYDQAALAILGENLTAQFNGLSFSAVFAGKSRTLNANSDTINIDAYSPSRALAYTPVESITQTNALTLLRALGVSRSIGLSDTGIKNLTAGQSALNLINAVANDMGGALLCDPAGNLTLAPSWQASGAEWVVNEDMILDYNEVFVDGVAYNRITVSDSASFNSLRTEVLKSEDVANEWMVYVYGGSNVTASHTQEQATLVALGVQLIDKSEQVEVINGVANLAYTPTVIKSVDWLHNAINAQMTLDGSRLLCGTDGDFGLLKVSYTVSASVFKLTYEKDEPIQLVIKGD